MSLKRRFKKLSERARLWASRDSDKYFWNRVREFRSLPDASPDNARFVLDLRFGNLPRAIMKAERAKHWLHIARTAYQDDPLTQFIVGELLFWIPSVSETPDLDIERMSLLAEAYGAMGRYDKAVFYFNSVVEAGANTSHEGFERCKSHLAIWETKSSAATSVYAKTMAEISELQRKLN